MADITQTQIDALIELNRVALSAALTSPKPNYSIGNRSVSYADYIKTLTETMNSLRSMSAEIPAEETVSFDSEITSTGTDNTQLEGDPDEV